MLSKALFWTGMNLVLETYPIQIHLRLSALAQLPQLVEQQFDG